MSTSAGFLSRALSRIEVLGNRLPHPTLLFIYLCGIVLALSAVFSWLGAQAEHPDGRIVHTVNLLSQEGLHQILNNTVKNFVGFAPVGTVLVAVMGIGVAEHAGLLSAVLRTTVLKAPRQLISFFVVFAGVLSSLAADTGYVVLIPLAGMVFAHVGRNPIAGIAAAFAGVSGGYSANLLIGPIDALLAGLSTEAAAIVAPTYSVNAAGNYYFMIASTFLISLVGTWVTEKIVAPRLDPSTAKDASMAPLKPEERRALRAVGIFSLVVIALLLLGLVPENGVLRHAQTGTILSSPFIKGIVTIIALYAALAGLIYGKLSGVFAEKEDFILGMEKSMATMASYLVLMFFAAQFVSYFSWSQLGIISAIQGAQMLRALGLGSATLLVAFVLLAALINLLIGSASAKWALVAPIFVPMLLLTGITPEATQLAFRIGDSTTNIITPLMPYFGVVLAFVQQYNRRAGIGTIITMMLPYTLVFILSWSMLLFVWILLDWPLGPGASIYYNLGSY